MAEDSSSTTSSSSNNDRDEQPPPRERRFYFTNTHFVLGDYVGNNGTLVANIPELDVAAEDLIVKLNKKDTRGLSAEQIRKLISSKTGAFNSFEILRHPFDRQVLNPRVSFT